MSNFANKKICILGFGKEGKSTYNYIRKYEKDLPIIIMDKNYKNMIINDKNVEFKDVNIDELSSFDMIFKTPGISLYDYDVSAFEDKITSQLEYFLDNVKGKTIGITGTKGKSTTASLIYKIIADQKPKTFLLGNIGDPFLEYLDDIDDDSYVVLELSALQLEYIDYSVNIGIMLNLFADHLDHFKTIKNYHDAKMNLPLYQKKDDCFIYNDDDPIIKKYIADNNYNSKLYGVSNINSASFGYMDEKFIYINNKPVFEKDTKMKLKNGEGNLFDIMCALCVCEILSLDYTKAISSIKDYDPLPHRLMFVGNHNNISYYDDSISTIPETCINAIKTLGNVNTVIVGGMNRNIDLSILISYLKNSLVENIICMPDTGYFIGENLKNYKNIFYANDVEEAVRIASEVTKENSICLLSPAAASYNKYKNFEERGDQFAKAVREL